ncbi:tetratricopeptide repeat-containing sensor histidine kinase [Mucilaginibacter sp. KACC 22063]|uniref:tetratricopeptide repeat-containing sensor histidine kinase n=1 Tax=Mucilaginibacter sp. KACC 22063 TaxID=3025666 RepID=UPI0023667753|nr:histidine kinase dimerization/phosphoacceptor domain -containing protein [Mucilaginibacter sp. KACC 22063]WDF56113.1 histidine kinase dimerization/phosphoacceptor domain -containing protein [Mucilaginibacter sp. KACC 22063]
MIRAKWIRIVLLFLLIVFTTATTNAQEILKYTLNDLLKKVNSPVNTKEQVNTLVNIASFYYNNKISSPENADSALYYAQKAAKLSARLKDTALLVKANKELAAAQLRSGHTTDAIAMYNQSGGDLHIALGLVIGKYYLYRSGEQKEHLDSAESYFNSVKKLGIKRHDTFNVNEADYLLSDLLYERGEIVLSKTKFLQVAVRAQKQGDLYHAAESYSRWGDHVPFSDASEKLKYYSLAKAIYAKAGNKAAENNLLKAIGDIHLNTGQLDLSEKEEKQVLKWYKDNGYKNLQDTYFLLSVISRNKGNLNEALEYALTAVDLSEKTGSDISDAYFYNEVAQIYGDLFHEQESIKWYMKTVQLLHRHNSELLFFSLKKLSEYFIQRGDAKKIIDLLNSVDNRNTFTELDKQLVAAIKGNAYAHDKKYDAAERAYLEMIKWESLNSLHTYNTADAYLTIANFYLQQRKFVQADYYLKHILTLPPNTFPLSRLKDVYLNLARSDSAKKDFAAALQHYKKFRQLNDSIFNQAKSRQIQELLIRYDVGQKEKDNDILRKQTQLQKAQLQKVKLLSRITVTGIIVLLFILVLIYAYIRNKKRSENLLALQQKEITEKNISLENLISKQKRLIEDKEWLIKEIHHRVKNNLQVVMSLLNTQMQYVDNSQVISALTDSQTRLYSISLIHQKLLQTEQVAFVEVRPYIIELVKFLDDTFHFQDKINFKYEIEDFKLGIAQAIPLGLIINEAITNIIKYAFPAATSGEMSLCLKAIDDHLYELQIADNGIGLRADFDPEQSDTLGMVLMRGLSAQLDGNITITSPAGVRLKVRFPKLLEDVHKI